MGFYWLAAAGAIVLIVATIFARILKTWLLLLAALAGVVAVSAGFGLNAAAALAVRSLKDMSSIL